MGKYLRTKGTRLLDPAISSPSLLILTAFLFLTGIFTGVFTAVFLPGDEKLQILQVLDHYLIPGTEGPMPGEILGRSLLINLGLLVLIILLTLAVFGFPGTLLIFVYKGMSLGFSAAMILETVGVFKGCSMVFATLVPQNFLYIPAFVLGGAAGISLDIQVLRNRRSGIKKSLTAGAGDFLLLMGFFSVVILAGCLIETFICPFLLQLS